MRGAQVMRDGMMAALAKPRGSLRRSAQHSTLAQRIWRDPKRMRLNRGHRDGVNREWDAPIQAVVTDSVGEGNRRQDVSL